MIPQNATAGTPAADGAPKKVRRGISNETRSTSQLKFHEKDAAPNRLFMAHLHDVRVEWYTGSDGTHFAGQKAPRLVFEFCSNTKDNAQMRHYNHSILPVESTVETIPGGKQERRVEQVLAGIKHLLDVYYLKGRELTAQEEDALTLPFTDFDEDGNYEAVDIEDVTNGYGVLFTNAAAMMNGTFNLADGETPKPCYRDEKGAYLRCWIKLLRHVRNAKGEWVSINRGDLGFTGFPGTGWVELAPTPNHQPIILNVDAAKESITPKEVKAKEAIPGVVPGTMVVDSPMMTGVAADNNAYAAAASDMPF